MLSSFNHVFSILSFCLSCASEGHRGNKSDVSVVILWKVILWVCSSLHLHELLVVL